MEMEISDSSDESVNKSEKTPRTPLASSDEDFVHAQNSSEFLSNEVNDSTTEEEDSESELLSEADGNDKEWQQVRKGNLIVNEYLGEEELLIENVDCNNPFSLYKLFFTDYILELMVEETNKYAVQCINSLLNSGKHQQAWQPVTKCEMNTFIGILLIMGVVPLPDIRLYWSKKNIYTNARIKDAMRRHRFLSILKFLHFSDNTVAKTEDGLHKIRNIVEVIVGTFKNVVKPGKNIVIDESVIPLKGRLTFRRCISGKRQKYGIKVHKLCLPGGYTYNVDIYARKNARSIEKTHSYDIVMRLVNGLLYAGRILFIDSYYMSVPLAEDLLEKKTFICGTVKITNKFLPPQAKQKQKRGDIMSFENSCGVKFLKWTDKKSVCMLTTSEKHTCTIIQGKKNKPKPDAVFSYNNAKKGVDLSDQVTSHNSCLRKIGKWYKRIVVQLICGTCFANAWYINQRWGSKRINIFQFREKIVDYLLTNVHHIEQIDIEKQVHSKQVSHFLQLYKDPPKKRCKECYKRLCKKKGKDYANSKAKRVTTYCDSCEGQPAFCLKCFEKLHGKHKQ